MQSSTALIFKSLLLTLAGLVAAAPARAPPAAASSPAAVARQAATTTELTFTGAGASFSITANVDGQEFAIPNAISVDFIAQTGSANCRFLGVDNAQLTVLGANTGATLAPPQTIVSGSCF